MDGPREQAAKRVDMVDMERLEAMFFQLLEADRSDEGFTALFDACHRLIGLALEAEAKAAIGAGEKA